MARRGGCGFAIEFPEWVIGPLCFGYACHFDLGVFTLTEFWGICALKGVAPHLHSAYRCGPLKAKPIYERLGGTKYRETFHEALYTM
jgi:hypothetical protein